MRHIDYFWRLGATGVAFAFIFVGGAILACVAVPVLSLSPGVRRDRVQYLIHIVFRFYISALETLGLLRLEFVGKEHLQERRGRLLVANHPSLLDVVILMAMVRNTQCIVKNELWNHAFLGGVMRGAGYIRNDLPAEALVAACGESLACGACLIIFPEGTRSESPAAPKFRRGFANIATLTRAPIQRVVITCNPPTLRRGELWWQIPRTRPTFRFVVEKIADQPMTAPYTHRSIETRQLVRSLEAYYAEKLSDVRL